MFVIAACFRRRYALLVFGIAAHSLVLAWKEQFSLSDALKKSNDLFSHQKKMERIFSKFLGGYSE